ncbi:hypothetical protein FB45DRAFT_1001434 [Roridomyces roridus]|uniref:Zn(2)-C6 fungal-type domain-containing protein n=1 Tax=Roridomyces roridus TaxID=1738132 RepID=A0AAD7C117_9AGAR|nr:hypothetical protein FB45DRAFT_1001434 [Roridomyces roridus]
MSGRHVHSPEEPVARVPIACTNCRKRKVKCVTESCQAACLRCERNGLDCEYVASDRQARFIGSSGSNTHTSHGQNSYMPPSPAKQPRQSHPNSSAHCAPPPQSNAHPRINTNASGLYRPAHQRSPMTPSSRLDMQYHVPDTQLLVGKITVTRSATRTSSTWRNQTISTSSSYAQPSVATAYAGTSNGGGYYCNNYPYSSCSVCLVAAPCHCGALRS